MRPWNGARAQTLVSLGGPPVPPLNPWDLCWKLETGRVSSRGMEMGTTVGRPQSLKQGWDHLDGRGFGLSLCELRSEAWYQGQGQVDNSEHLGEAHSV